MTYSIRRFQTRPFLPTALALLAALTWAVACETEKADDDATGGAGGEEPGSGGEPAGGGAPELGGAAGEGPSAGEGKPEVEPNPNNVLSVYVSWKTKTPASSIVQFGAGGLRWEIEGQDHVTDHRVLVIGMRPETTYQLRAISVGEDETFDQMVSYHTGELPVHIPVGVITVRDADKMQPGWTLMNVQYGNDSTFGQSLAPPTAVAYDDQGFPVWYFVHGSANELGGAISVDPTERGVLMGPTLGGFGQEGIPPIEVDWAGNPLWTCDDPLCGQPDQLSHHAGRLSNGNTIVMRDAGEFPGLIQQIFYEYAPGNPEPVHQIGVEDAMAPPESATGDWAHGNSITVDLESDVAYMSCRWLGLFKLTYSTGQLLWHLPARYGQEKLGLDFGSVEFEPPESQFSDIHDPEVHADGTILFFDNGGYSDAFPILEGNPEGRQSRAVEYLIDEESDPPKAKLVWEWPGKFPVDAFYTTELYVPFWGDADRLDNGNVLITAGRRGGEETPQSRAIEVNRETGEIVWEMELPGDHGVYRSERMVPPLLKKIER